MTRVKQYRAFFVNHTVKKITIQDRDAKQYQIRRIARLSNAQPSREAILVFVATIRQSTTRRRRESPGALSHPLRPAI